MTERSNRSSRSPRVTRRELLKTGLVAGTGLASLVAFGCAPAPSPAAPAPTAAPAKSAPAPTTAPAKSAPAPTTAPAKSAPSKRTEVQIVIGAEISTFDNNKVSGMENQSLITGVAERLTRMSKTKYGELEPWLATSWESVGPTRWRFKLRQGVKFHNGAEFNGEAVKWSIENFAKTAVNKIYFEAVDHVEVVDKYTIDIVTGFPTGLIALYTNAAGNILDPKWMTGSEYSPERGIGTGAARFVEWVKGQRVVLEANPDYWHGRLSYDGAVYRAISEGSTRANAAIAGEGDVVRNILPQDVDRIKARPGVKVPTVASNRVVSIRIRDDLPPFDNKLVRQACNYAVNVPEICTNVLKGYGLPVRGQMQAEYARHWQKDVQPYPYDPEKAKSLLAQAGFPKGFTTKFGTSRGRDQGDFEFVQALAGQLKQVGIDAEVVLHESGDYASIYSGQKPSEPLFYYSSGNIIPDAENALRDLLSDRSYRVHAKEMDDIYKRLQRAVDVKEREPIAREGILYTRDYAPVIFGYQIVQAYAVSGRVDWTPRSDEYIMLNEIAFKAA